MNVIAPIFTNEKGLYLQTIFYPLQISSNHVKGSSLTLSLAAHSYTQVRVTVA